MKSILRTIGIAAVFIVFGSAVAAIVLPSFGIENPEEWGRKTGPIFFVVFGTLGVIVAKRTEGQVIQRPRPESKSDEASSPTRLEEKAPEPEEPRRYDY